MNRGMFLRRMASAVVGVGMLGSELFARGHEVGPDLPTFVPEIGRTHKYLVQYDGTEDRKRAYIAKDGEWHEIQIGEEGVDIIHDPSGGFSIRLAGEPLISNPRGGREQISAEFDHRREKSGGWTVDELRAHGGEPEYWRADFLPDLSDRGYGIS